MELKYSLRPPVTYRCNHLHGVNTNTTILVFVPLMVLSALYCLYMSDLFQTWNLLECLASKSTHKSWYKNVHHGWQGVHYPWSTTCSRCRSELPSFVLGGKQLTEAEILHTRKIASVRIHVKHAIGLIKNFAILKGNLPLRPDSQFIVSTFPIFQEGGHYSLAIFVH